MPNLVDIARIRRMVEEPETTTYSDEDLTSIFEVCKSDYNATASVIWSEKSAKHAADFNINADGNDMELSKRHEQALRMAMFYSSRSRVHMRMRKV